MLSKQLASKLKEEKEKDPSYSANLQCDRLIRTVSCKHDANHAIRRTNINILQCFDEIKLYVRQSQSKSEEDQTEASGEQTDAEGNKKPMSCKLPRRNQSFKVNCIEAEMEETDLKQILDKIVNFVTLKKPSEWFCFKNESNELIDLIQDALGHIDYNLKRNSDFINELTRLLDTSRALKQEAQLRKLLQHLEDEKSLAVSQPPSPMLQNKDNQSLKEEKKKTKSFRAFHFNRSKSKSGSQPNITITDQNSETRSNYLTLPGQHSRQISAASSLTNLENNFQKQVSLSQNQTHEINNSDYNLLELEVEKISFYLDTLYKSWSKLSVHRSVDTTDVLKFSVEFQNILNALNSPVVVTELEQSLFKLNWLITSKSGFCEPNWKTSVVSITPSTHDSFIGVNLLKNYYKYVKYDFVSYKLFTRQLQLVQIGAILLNLIHRVIVFYRETNTLSTISSTLNSLNNGTLNGQNLFNDAFNPSLLSMTFSADRYRPISWSANHVTLYNVQSRSEADKSSRSVSRSSSTRRPQEPKSYVSREDQIKSIKTDLFIQEMHEFLDTCSARLNIQADLTNRTGYFYIVNQSTGLVLQAVDFTSQSTLKEQIEENQKRLKNSSIKGRLNGNRTPQAINKGPRFYLMPKSSALANASPPEDQSLQKETANDEQLWYYYLINGCIANKIIRSGHCMAASSLNPKSPVTFWPNVKTTNCSWYLNAVDQTIVSGLSDELVLDYVLVDEPPNQRYAVVIDTKVANKASQKWSIEFC